MSNNFRKMKYSPEINNASGLLYLLENNEIDITPSYQREFVWQEPMQRELIYSVMLQNPIGTITLWNNSQRNLKEVIDGQQRLRTLEKFKKNHLLIDGKTAKNIISAYETEIDKILNSENTKSNENFKKAVKLKTLLTKANPKIKFSDFISRMVYDFEHFQIPIMNIDHSDECEIRDYFRRIQHQEKLKAGEIINSIDSLVLKDILKQIEDIDKLKNILGFSNDKRLEFNKIYYSLIGIFEGKFTLGVLDKKIVQYIEELDTRASDFYNNLQLQQKIQKLNINLNNITDLNINMELGRSDLKFLIFQCAYDFYGLKEKYGLFDIIKAFGIVCKRFKAFYSYKTQDQALADYFPYDLINDKELIAEYSLISSLRKSSHKLESFDDKMKRMIKLIEKEINRGDK